MGVGVGVGHFFVFLLGGAKRFSGDVLLAFCNFGLETIQATVHLRR